MFMATLFIITPNWKQTRYPSISEWINPLWYIQTMSYYSVAKKKWAIKPDYMTLRYHVFVTIFYTWLYE